MLFTFYLKQRPFDFFKKQFECEEPAAEGGLARGRRVEAPLPCPRPRPCPRSLPLASPASSCSAGASLCNPAAGSDRSLSVLVQHFRSLSQHGSVQGSADYGHVGPPPVVVDKVTGTICVCVASGSVPWPTKPLQPLTKSVR